MTPQAAVEEAVRQSYSRLLAYLVARSRDFASAEDALGEALKEALERWAGDGVPEKPEAWLLVAARRRLIDQQRRRQTAHRAESALAEAARHLEASPGDRFPDERLKLLFVCAHPAIDESIRTPLMLHTVMGLDAAHIAAAFLTSPAAMSQRLVRAKQKIRDAGIPFVTPEHAELPARSAAVLDAIYAAYGAGWEDVVDGAHPYRGLAAEAAWLARLVVSLLPESAEARGLLALILYCESRRAARRDAAGRFVPLRLQDCGLWDRAAITEAEHHLREAARRQQPGRYQLEAAIQSVHAERLKRGHTEWAAIVYLYERLAVIAPSLGATAGLAAALLESRGPAAALAVLESLPEGAVARYQPYWAVLAQALKQAGQPKAARSAAERAAGLTSDPALRAYLLAGSANATEAL